MFENTQARLLAVSMLAAATVGGTALADDDVERNTCLRYDQVEALHQLDEDHIMLEVDEGQTLYLLSLEDQCFGSSARQTISIEEGGNDGCMRTTDRVNYGRRQCRIEGFTLIENEAQLEEALAETD